MSWVRGCPAGGNWNTALAALESRCGVTERGLRRDKVGVVLGPDVHPRGSIRNLHFPWYLWLVCPLKTWGSLICAVGLVPRDPGLVGCLTRLAQRRLGLGTLCEAGHHPASHRDTGPKGGQGAAGQMCMHRAMQAILSHWVKVGREGLGRRGSDCPLSIRTPSLQNLHRALLGDQQILPHV